MPAWPGGPCPECGEEMPARVIHCRNCRQLLNEDLDDDTIPEPVFVPLREISDVPQVEPRGVYEDCQACGRELKISRRFAGSIVRCKFCGAGFSVTKHLNPKSGRNAYYTDCPHCNETLRVGTKYLGHRVCCKHCQGELQIELDGQSRATSH